MAIVKKYISEWKSKQAGAKYRLCAMLPGEIVGSGDTIEEIILPKGLVRLTKSSDGYDDYPVGLPKFEEIEIEIDLTYFYAPIADLIAALKNKHSVSLPNPGFFGPYEVETGVVWTREIWLDLWGGFWAPLFYGVSLQNCEFKYDYAGKKVNVKALDIRRVALDASSTLSLCRQLYSNRATLPGYKSAEVLDFNFYDDAKNKDFAIISADSHEFVSVESWRSKWHQSRFIPIMRVLSRNNLIDEVNCVFNFAFPTFYAGSSAPNGKGGALAESGLMINAETFNDAREESFAKTRANALEIYQDMYEQALCKAVNISLGNYWSIDVFNPYNEDNAIKKTISRRNVYKADYDTKSDKLGAVNFNATEVAKDDRFEDKKEWNWILAKSDNGSFETSALWNVYAPCIRMDRRSNYNIVYRYSRVKFTNIHYLRSANIYGAPTDFAGKVSEYVKFGKNGIDYNDLFIYQNEFYQNPQTRPFIESNLTFNWKSYISIYGNNTDYSSEPSEAILESQERGFSYVWATVAAKLFGETQKCVIETPLEEIFIDFTQNYDLSDLDDDYAVFGDNWTPLSYEIDWITEVVKIELIKRI